MVSKFCEKCGTKREENSLFCIKCGCRFPDESDVKEKNSSDKQQVYVTASSDTVENAQENPQNYGQAVLQDASDKKAKKVKKPSYKVEILVLVLSVICFIGSLGFFLVMKTTAFDSIGFVRNLKHLDNAVAEGVTEIPELTVEMAEEILNNATDFPYYHFESSNMLDKNDYIIHPISVDSGYEVKCYAVEGIDTLDDYYTYFEKFGTREFIEKNLTHEAYYILKDTKPYFSPNEWMGNEPYIAESLCLEKIDDETFLARKGGNDSGVVLKYIDGAFKATDITPEEAVAQIDSNATIVLPQVQYGMSLDRAERELNKLGLKLDRNDITYIKPYWGMDGYDHYVSAFKKSYMKHKTGDSVGVFVAVEDPETYVPGSIPDIVTDDYARELLINASATEMKWLQFLYRFIDESSKYEDADRCHYVDRSDYIDITLNGYTYQAYAVVDDQIKSVADLYSLYNRYFDKEYADRACDGYVDSDGKLYVPVGDAGLWDPCIDYTDNITKISDNHYRYCLIGHDHYDDSVVEIFYDIVLEDGKWVFTEKYADEYDTFFHGFMPIEDASTRISD